MDNLRFQLEGEAADLSLLDGWTATSVPRAAGPTGGRKSSDIYYHSPCGQKLRSYAEVRRFLGLAEGRARREPGNACPCEEAMDSLRAQLEGEAADLNGWSATLVPRSAGLVGGRRQSSDIYYHSPCGQKLRSTAEVRRFLDGRKLPRSKRQRLCPAASSSSEHPDEAPQAGCLAHAPPETGRRALGRRVSLLWSTPPEWFHGTIRDVGVAMTYYVV